MNKNTNLPELILNFNLFIFSILLFLFIDFKYDLYFNVKDNYGKIILTFLNLVIFAYTFTYILKTYKINKNIIKYLFIITSFFLIMTLSYLIFNEIFLNKNISFNFKFLFILSLLVLFLISFLFFIESFINLKNTLEAKEKENINLFQVFKTYAKEDNLNISIIKYLFYRFKNK